MANTVINVVKNKDFPFKHCGEEVESGVKSQVQVLIFYLSTVLARTSTVSILGNKRHLWGLMLMLTMIVMIYL